MEAQLSSRLLSNWKEELDELRKEMIQNRSLGDGGQHGIQQQFEGLKKI